MFKSEGLTSPEKTEAKISLTEKEVDVVIKNVKLESEAKEILGRFIVKVEKAPLDMSSIKALHVVDFSMEDEKTSQVVEEAKKLSEIVDEKERIDKLLKVFKTHVTYAYEHVLEAKANELGVPKESLDKFGTKGNTLVSFSEMLNSGVGICGHLSDAYLYLADKANLKGIIVHSHPSFTPINIIRTDKEEKLFKSFEVGQKTSNHAWVEIQLGDGTWVPVDPSTEITGTTPKGMEMFKEAKYMGNLLPYIEYKCENSNLGSRGCKEFDGVTPAGEKEFTVDMQIGLKQQLLNKEKRAINSK